MINGINLTDFYASKVLISKLQNFFLKRRQLIFDNLSNIDPEPSSQENKLNQSNSPNTMSNNNNKATNQIKKGPNASELLSANEYEERLRHIKLGILHVKLLSFTQIIKKELKLRYIFFIERVRLKKNMEHLFKTDDNFLYFFPQQKFFKFANNYAYKKLSYVFKSYKYRMNFLMRNIFHLWRFKTHLSLITIPEKESILHKKCSALIVLMHNIIVKHQLTHSIQKLIFFYWVNISKQDNYSLTRINKGIIFLQNFFSKYKRETFYALPHRNYAYIKLLYERLLKHLNTNNRLYTELCKSDSISQKSVEKILFKVIPSYKEAKQRNYSFKRKNRLLKLFTQHNLKNTFNKQLFIAFRKLKQLTNKKMQEDEEMNTLNDMVTDLKCDSLLNGSLIISAFVKKKMLCEIVFLKQKLVDRLRDKATLKNTLFEYGEKYQEIISMLPKERRLDLLIVRNKYKKIFKLKKILLTLFKHQFDLNDNNHSAQKRYLEGCFYRWKAYICESVRKRNLKIFLFSHMAVKLHQKIVLNVRNQFLTQLIINAYAKTEKKKYQYQSSINIIRKIKKVFLSQKLSFFFKLFLKPYRMIKKKEFLSMRLVSIYSKKCKLKKPHSSLNKLRLHLKQWYNKTRLTFNSKEIALIGKKTLKKHYMLFNITRISIGKKKRNAIRRWRNTIKKHYYKSKNCSIDSKIIMNMSAILQEYEIEDTKVKHEIIKCKFAMSKGRSLLRCIYAKHMHVVMFYFMLWRRKEAYAASFADLLAEAESIKIENESLIKTYYDKKNQYKKIIFDYEYMKKHYCSSCMGETIEIDYKSINDEVFTDSNNQEIDDHSHGNNNNNAKGHECNENKVNYFDSENYRIDSQEENMNIPNRVNRTTEKENLINEYQNEYNNQLRYYEDYITTMKRKKEDLLSIKKMLLEKKINKSKNHYYLIIFTKPLLNLNNEYLQFAKNAFRLYSVKGNSKSSKNALLNKYLQKELRILLKMEEFINFPIQDMTSISKSNSKNLHSLHKESYKKKYLQQRKSLIQLLRSLSESKALYNNEEVFYMSLAFLDQVLCSNYIAYTNNNLTTIGICCFSLALKFIGDFNEKIFKSDLFKVNSFRKFEFKCISYLQYNLSMTSVFDHLKLLTIGSTQLFNLAKKVLLLSVNQDFSLNYDNATFAAGICNFAREKLKISNNARQSKAYSCYKDKESLNLPIVEIVALLKSLEKNKRQNLSTSCSYSSYDTIKQIPDVLIRDDFSDSTTYSTHSQKSNDNNNNNGRAKANNKTQASSICQTKRSNHDSNNSSFLTSKIGFRPNIQPIKTIETMKSVFYQNKTRGLAIDLTQLSKINFSKLNSLSSRFQTNQK